MDENGLQVKIIELDRTVAVLEAELRCSLDARDLQAKEYERRLSELNHAHEQQMTRNAEYVSRETWELKNTAVESRLTALDKWHWISIGIASVAGGILGALVEKLVLH